MTHTRKLTCFKALDNWMKVYERIAGSAFKPRPDLAKKINLVVR